MGIYHEKSKEFLPVSIYMEAVQDLSYTGHDFVIFPYSVILRFFGRKGTDRKSWGWPEPQWFCPSPVYVAAGYGTMGNRDGAMPAVKKSIIENMA